jgi:hypothetical protein
VSISGTRGLIRLSKNVNCVLQAAMAVERIDELAFYESVTGTKFLGEYGERYAARRRGAKFETNLHQNNAALLRAALAPLYGLDAESMSIRNLSEEVPGPPKTMRAKRLIRMKWILRDLAAGKDVPYLVIQPQFALPTGTPRDEYVGPDFVVLDPRKRIYVPGEEKSFITRENVAEPGDLDLTRRQAGAQILGLRAVLEQIDVGVAARVENRAVFVFATPYGLRPATPVEERLEAEVHEVSRGLAAYAAAHQELKRLRAQRGQVKLAVLAEDLPSYFQEGCFGSCIMAPWCEVQHAGTARSLGDAAADILGANMEIDRLGRLLTGVESPAAGEADLVAEIKKASTALGLDEQELIRRLAS